MLHQILDLRTIFRGETITRRIRDVDHGSASLDDRFNHTCQILILRATGILSIKLHVIDKLTGILHSGNRTLNNLLTRRIKLIADMRVRSTDTGMDTLMLGISQGIHCHINILLHRACQRTNRGPGHRL